jgi:hypothetical protein
LCLHQSKKKERPKEEEEEKKTDESRTRKRKMSLTGGVLGLLSFFFDRINFYCLLESGFFLLSINNMFTSLKINCVHTDVFFQLNTAHM